MVSSKQAQHRLETVLIMRLCTVFLTFFHIAITNSQIFFALL
jgi:hypothetical protein